MWADTLMLMRHYWKLDRREYSRVRGWKLIGYIAALIAFLFMGAFSAALGYGASFLLRPDMPVRVGPGVFPGILLTFVLLGVLITGLNQAVRALFLSGDLERLVVAPVRTRSIMVAKLLSRLPGNVSLLLIVAVPAFVAYGIGAGAGVDGIMVHRGPNTSFARRGVEQRRSVLARRVPVLQLSLIHI